MKLPTDISRDLEHIAKHYGEDHQQFKFVEEIGECITALGRYRAAETQTERAEARQNFIEELADVYVMWVQMVRLLNATSEVNDMILFKVNRQKNRISNMED